MNQIKTIILVSLIILSAFSAQGQPDWTVNPRNYDYNMTVTGVIKLDFIESINPNDRIGAFFNNECVGVSQP